MAFDSGAFIVGGISILTLIITKLKCYAKKNGSCNYGVGFMDRSLIDEDDTEIKTIDLGNVHVMYVKNKHHYSNHHEEEEDESEDEE
jgi:hypothetical protein